MYWISFDAPSRTLHIVAGGFRAAGPIAWAKAAMPRHGNSLALADPRRAGVRTYRYPKTGNRRIFLDMAQAGRRLAMSMRASA